MSNVYPIPACELTFYDKQVLGQMHDFVAYVSASSDPMPIICLAQQAIIEHLTLLGAEASGNRYPLQTYIDNYERLAPIMVEVAEYLREDISNETRNLDLEIAAELLLHIHTNHAFYISDDGLNVMDMNLGFKNFDTI